MSSAAEVIHGIREYIESNGWTQNKMMDAENGSVCIVGGMVYSLEWYPAAEDDDTLVEMLDEIPEAGQALRLIYAQIVKGMGYDQRAIVSVLKEGSSPLSGVCSWNDTKEREYQEVLDLLNKAEKVALAGFDPDLGISIPEPREGE